MTTISDDFNRANSDSLGSSSEGWSWTEVAGDSDIAGNTLASGADGTHYARAETDLSTDDHYVEANCTQIGTSSGSAVGLVARYSSSANTGIVGYIRYDASQYRLFRMTAGSFTQIGSTTSEALPSVPFTARLTVDGTAIALSINSVDKVTTTSSHAVGNIRAGLVTGQVSSQQNRWDDFVAADLGGGGGIAVFYVHHLAQMTQ